MDVLEKAELEANFELDQLGTKLEVGSDEHKKAMSDAVQLIDRITELKKVENERERLRLDEAKMEADKNKADIEQQRVDLEREKHTAERKHNIIRYVLDGLAIAVPAGITALGLFLTYNIEVDGVQASQIGRKTIDRLFRMK